jgi:hypothetical protein
VERGAGHSDLGSTDQREEKRVVQHLRLHEIELREGGREGEGGSVRARDRERHIDLEVSHGQFEVEILILAVVRTAHH